MSIRSTRPILSAGTGQTMTMITSFAAVLLAAVGAVRAQTVYSCDFEPLAQGEAFHPGSIEGQGTPPWAGFFASAYDIAGSVVENDSAKEGSQCLHLSGYQTSHLTLPEAATNQWFEFAYRPNFREGTPGTAWVCTTRGDKADAAGIWIGLQWDGEIGIVVVASGIPAGDGAASGTEIGAFTNDQWQTMSFQTDNFSGSYKVFLGDVPAGTFGPPGFTGIKTVVFSTATQNWQQTGDWKIDGIHIGDAPVYATP